VFVALQPELLLTKLSGVKKSWEQSNPGQPISIHLKEVVATALDGFDIDALQEMKAKMASLKEKFVGIDPNGKIAAVIKGSGS